MRPSPYDGHARDTGHWLTGTQTSRSREESVPERSLRVEISEYDLKISGVPLQHRQGDEGVKKVLRVVEEVCEGVSLQNEGRLFDPDVALQFRVRTARQLDKGLSPVLVPACRGHQS